MKQYISNLVEGDSFIYNKALYTIKVPFDTDVDPQALNEATGNIEMFNPYTYVTTLSYCDGDGDCDFDGDDWAELYVTEVNLD